MNKDKEGKSMLEKLTEDYNLSVKQGNKGHAIGFYNESGEEIGEVYKFPNAKFTIKLVNGNFFW